MFCSLRQQHLTLRAFVGVSLTLLTTALTCPGPVRAQNLYVSTGDNQKITQVTPAGAVSIFAGSVGNPAGVTFDTGGALYVAGSDGFIRKVTPGGTVSTFATTVQATSPAGIVFDTSGNLFVATGFGGNLIRKITPSGVVSTFANLGTNAAYGLAFDTSGNLYASTTSQATDNTFTITRITPGGTASTFAGAGLSTPKGLAFDTSGNLFVANEGVNTSYISKITPGGTVTLFASDQFQLSLPAGLAFNAAGDLFVANESTGRISRITPDGGITTFATGLARPRFLAFAPAAAPEPSAVAVFGLAAVVLVGLMLRRRVSCGHGRPCSAALVAVIGTGLLAAPPARAQILAPISPLGTPGVVRLGANGDRLTEYTFTTAGTYSLYGTSSSAVTVGVDGYVSVGGGYVWALNHHMTQTSDGVAPQGYISYQEQSQGLLVSYVNMPYITYYNNFPMNNPPSSTFQVMLYKSGGIGVGYGFMDSNSFAVNYWPSPAYGLSNGPVFSATKFSHLTGGCAGGLDHVQYPGLLGGQQYFLKDTNGDGCYEKVTQAVAAAPEPRPVLALTVGALGLSGLLVLRRRR